MAIPSFMKSKRFKYIAAIVVIAFILYMAFMPEINATAKRLVQGKVEGNGSGVDRDLVVKKGDRSAESLQLQKDIISNGGALPKYGADGIFGSESVAALKDLTGQVAISLNGFSKIVKEKNGLVVEMAGGYDGSGIAAVG